MKPLSALFGLGVHARNTLYDRGLARSHRLSGPVVSIGNLSLGGSGKTPFVLLLGELLKARGLKFDILSRGYGRKTRGVALVDPAGSPRDYGDEPLLMARRLGVPVIVGESRYAAGIFAEQKLGPQLHLLDDGFQHRSLARDFDIVLVTPEDARDCLLPAGRLREPLTSLRRADAVVLASGASPEAFPLDRSWSGERVAGSSRLTFQPGHRVLRHRAAEEFCGPAAHRRNRAGGRSLLSRPPCLYRAGCPRSCWTCGQRSEADGFVTTEKDAVNLGGYLSALHSLAVVPVKMELTDAANAVDTILASIAERRRSREKIGVPLAPASSRPSRRTARPTLQWKALH